MPRIHTVAADGTITAGDKLIGSDGAENANFVTRNYTVGGVKDFILGGTHAGSFTTLTTTGNATIGGNVTIAGNITVGDADTDTVSFAADVISNIIPDATNTYNLGSAAKEWKDLHLSKSARIADIYLDGSTNQISGVTDIYAQKIYDSNDNTYFLDPSASISLKVKGNIQLGDVNAETNSEITSYGDLILKADVDNDGVYERGVEIFRARGGNDGGTAVELNRNQYDLNGQALPDNIWASIVVGKKIYGLGGGSNYQNVTNATISAIVGWMDGSDTDLGNDLSVVPAGATKLRVTMNTSISYANSAYLTILDSSATFNEDVTRNIKFFSGSSEIASIDKDGKLIIGEIASSAAFSAASITTSGNIVATGTIVANNTNTINGININNSNQEISGIGNIYAHKFFDSQDDNYYIDPGHAGISVNVAGQIIGAGNANIGGIAINASNKEVSGVGDLYAYKFYDSQDTNYYIDPGHGTLSIKTAGGANIAGISINASNKEVSGVGDLYAYKFIDSQTGSHYLDPGNSTLSLVIAGKATIGAFTIPKTIGTSGQVLKVPSSGTELEWGSASGLTGIQEGSEFYASVLVGSSTTGTLNNARLNVGVGVNAIRSITEGDSNVAVGYNAAGLLTVGDKNIAIGDNALAQAPGSNENVAIGHYALYSQDATNNAQAYTVAVGMRAGYLIEHDQPFATCIGAYAGDSITTGQYNTIIGSTADVSAATDNNSIVIGALAGGHGSNIAVIGNGSITAWHPGSDNGADLGSTSYSFKDAYVQGRVNAGDYKVDALNTAPSSASDTGTVGEIRYTADYIYVCVASNTWKRAALSTW